MIEVNLYYSPGQTGKIYGFDLEGHANSAEHGKDLLCCAVSTLAISTVNAITESAGLKDETEFMAREGKLQLFLKTIPDPEKRKMAEFSLEAFQYNIEMLAQQYPEYIDIKQRKDGSK